MQEGTLTSKDGTTLFTRSHGPADATRHVLIVHGYGEHSGRYVELMQGFANAGVASFAFDLRGHGKSQGARGFVKRFDEYLEDVQAAHDAFGHGAKTQLFGHSLGGLISIHYLAKNPNAASAFMVSAPYVGRALKVNPVKLLAGRVLGKIAPKIGIESGLAGDMVSHDPKEIELYNTDPLMITKATGGWFLATEHAMAHAKDAAMRIQAPTYWMHGESDPLASFAVSREVYERVESRDKQFIALAGMRHEPLHEIERARVISQLCGFSTTH